MGFFAWIVVGLIAGLVATSITGYERKGCLFTIVIGVAGAVLGGALFNWAADRPIAGFGLWTLFVSIVGATLLLLVLQALQRRS